MGDEAKMRGEDGWEVGGEVGEEVCRRGESVRGWKEEEEVEEVEEVKEEE